VVICGYGRVGQTVARLLSAEGIPYAALDNDPHIVSACRKEGRSVYFGDTTRREVLNAVAIQKARAVVVTVNDFRTAYKTVTPLHNHRPDLAIIARANDLQHILRLEKAGASLAVSEKYEASLQVGAAVLKRMEIADHEISRITELYRDRDYALTRANEVVSDTKSPQKSLLFRKASSIKAALKVSKG